MNFCDGQTDCIEPALAIPLAAILWAIEIGLRIHRKRSQ